MQHSGIQNHVLCLSYMTLINTLWNLADICLYSAWQCCVSVQTEGGSTIRFKLNRHHLLSHLMNAVKISKPDKMDNIQSSDH